MHLNLSDNLLGLKEVKKLASLLSSKNNYPLKILNLSKNLLDHRSAKIIGDALTVNKTLEELDISYNQIGDWGVAMVVLPIAKFYIY